MVQCAAKGDRYDWDRAPSTPCPKLLAQVCSFGFLNPDVEYFE